jgi:WD40 repeat protein
VTGGDHFNLHSWDGEVGTPSAVYAGHVAGLSSVGMLDQDRFVSASADGSIKVWQRNPPWRLERTIGSIDQPDLISHRVLSLDFNPDSSQLLVAGGVPSRDGQLRTFILMLSIRHVSHRMGNELQQRVQTNMSARSMSRRGKYYIDLKATPITY